MTEPSFGNSFDFANVSLSFLSTGTVGLSESTDIPKARYLSDDEGNRNFAIYGGNALKTYDVILTGSARIDLISTTAFVPQEDSPYTTNKTYLGMKKSGSAYCVYYAVYNDRTTLSQWRYFRFRKMTITPGVGGVDEILYEVPVSTNTFPYISTITIGHKVYYAIATGRGGVGSGNYGFSIAIYSLDMDTDAIGGGFVWDSGGTADHPRRIYVPGASPVVSLGNRNGTLVWITGYVDKINWGGIGLKTNNVYVVVNGSESLIYTKDSTAPIHADPGQECRYGGRAQYNQRDVILWMNYDTSEIESAVLYGAGITTYINGTTPDIKVPYSGADFKSNNVFPGLYYDGTDWWWINPATGLLTSQLTIAGVDPGDIYTVFPTIDTIDGSIYVAATINGDEKILGIRVNTGEIVHQIDVSVQIGFDPLTGFNHGNYVEYWKGSSAAIKYLTGNVARTPNVVQMIPEMS